MNLTCGRRAKTPALGPPPGDGLPPVPTYTSASRSYSPECVEYEFYEVRIGPPLYGRASYVYRLGSSWTGPGVHKIMIIRAGRIMAP